MRRVVQPFLSARVCLIEVNINCLEIKCYFNTTPASNFLYFFLYVCRFDFELIDCKLLIALLVSLRVAEKILLVWFMSCSNSHHLYLSAMKVIFPAFTLSSSFSTLTSGEVHKKMPIWLVCEVLIYLWWLVGSFRNMDINLKDPFTQITKNTLSPPTPFR